MNHVITVLNKSMDLLKAYDCLPDDLIIEKSEAYGFDSINLKLFHTVF